MDSSDEWMRQAQWMRRLARSLVVDQASADDLTQDAWVAALKHPPLEDRPLRPWLGRVVSNLARNTRRGESRRKAREQATWSERTAPAASDIAAELELQRLLLDAVEALDEPFRATLVRAYMHGRSTREIADEDGIAESTVRWRIHHALQELRSRLDDRHHGNREAWSLLLLPLVDRGSLAAPTGIAASAAGTMFAMHISMKLALVTGAAVLAVSITRVDTSPSSPQIVDVPARTESAGELSQIQDADRARAPIVAVPAVAAAAEPVQAASPVLHPQPLPPAVVEARIVDANGIAVHGARLTCVDRVDSRQIEPAQATSATAANDGTVRLELTRAEEPKGRGRAKAMPADMWPVTLEVSGPAHATERRSLEVRAGQATSLGEITLQPGGHIAGRVVDEAGLGLANVSVGIVLPVLTLEERDSVASSGLTGKTRKYRARTTAEGTFELRGLSTGLYRAAAKADAYLGVISDVFEVRAGELTQLPDLIARDNVNAVTGTVLGLDGKPVSATVKFLQSGAGQTPRWNMVTAAKDGSFRIEPRLDLPLDIYVTRDDRDDETAGDAYLRGIACGSRGIVMSLQPPRFVTLRVVDPAGRPVSDYLPMIQDSGGTAGGRRVESAEPQLIRVLGMPFTIRISKAGCPDVVAGPYDPERLPSELTLTLIDVASVTGRVTMNGAPVYDAEVMLAELASPGDTNLVNGFPVRASFTGAKAHTAADGTFRLPIPRDGRYRVVARRAAVAWTESADRVFESSRAVDGIELDFDSRGSLFGHVRGFDNGANGARFVVASRGLSWVRCVPIVQDGSYRIDDLAAGEWSVMIARDDLSATTRMSLGGTPHPSLRTTRVEANGTTRQDLEWTVPVPVEIAGSVRVGEADMRAWSVGFADPSRRNSVTEQMLARDGAYRITLPESGRVHLRFGSGPSPDREDAIELDVDVRPGVTGPRLELVTGSIVLDGEWSREITATCSLAAGTTWTTRLRPVPGADGRIDGLPVGRHSIRAGDQELAVVEVSAGIVARSRAGKHPDGK